MVEVTESSLLTLPQRLPQPVALPLRKLHSSSRPEVRQVWLDRAIQMLIRCLAFAALAEYRQGPEDDDLSEARLTQAAERGDWADLLEALRPPLLARGEEQFAPDLWTPESATWLGQASDTSRDFRARLAALLTAASPLARYTMGFLADHREDRLEGVHRYVLHRCQGSDECFGYSPFSDRHGLPEGAVLLLHPSGLRALVLEPLVRCEVSPHGEVLRTFVLSTLTDAEATWESCGCSHRLVAGPDSEEHRACQALVTPASGRRFAPERLQLRLTPAGPGESGPVGASLMEGTVVDSWRIVAPLRPGGSAEIYLVESLDSTEIRLLKVLRPDLARDHRQVLRFERAGRLALQVRHPRLVGAVGMGYHHHLPYLVMEYLPGGDLQRRLDADGPMPLDQAIRTLDQMAQGLAELHRRGLMHRDLKPSNVLFAEDGQASLADFGLARPELGLGLTASATLLGTFGYLAPEQQEGRPADRRSDLYALATTALVMTRGRLPRSPEEIQTALAAWPPRIRTCLRACLEEDPDRRPGSLAPLLRLLNMRMPDPDPDRQFTTWRSDLMDRLRAWREGGLADELLLPAAELPQARCWRESHQDCLTRPELEFLAESERINRATPERRAAAWAIDTVLVLVGIVTLFHGVVRVTTLGLLAMAGFLLYQALADSHGRTLPGRRLLGIRLVDRAGRPLTWVRALARVCLANPTVLCWVVLATSLRIARASHLPTLEPADAGSVYLAATMLTLPLLQGMLNLFSLYSRRSNLAVHDRILGTQVVLATPDATEPPPGGHPPAPDADR
jgi:serine/threonine protein kinase/uncharacterized RDD family membrane protein YckC